MTVTRRIAGHWLRGCHCRAAKQRGNNECCRILHSGLFISFCRCRVESKRTESTDMNPQKTTIAILAALSASLALADDFKTVNGKEYKDATVTQVEPDGIVVKTKSGISKLYFQELPKEVQQRFNYDPGKANAYAADQNAAYELVRKQQEEVTQQKAGQLAKEQAAIQQNTEQVRNVQTLQERHFVLQQDEATLSARIGELQQFPEYLTIYHTKTPNASHGRFRYKNPARADLPSLESQLTAVRKEKEQVEKQLQQAQH